MHLNKEMKISKVPFDRDSTIFILENIGFFFVFSSSTIYITGS